MLEENADGTTIFLLVFYGHLIFRLHDFSVPKSVGTKGSFGHVKS